MSAAEAISFRQIPVNPLQIGSTLVKAITHNVVPVDPRHRETPQLNLAFQDARWFLLARLDSATVGTADGRGVTFRQRDPQAFRRLMTGSSQLLRQMRKSWPELQKEWQAAAPDLTSVESWGERSGPGPQSGDRPADRRRRWSPPGPVTPAASAPGDPAGSAPATPGTRAGLVG